MMLLRMLPVLAMMWMWTLPAGAAPSASFVAHRGTSGGPNAAPVYVHFDATATTSSIDGDKPFFDLLYEWDFGDPASGSWATSGLPKNRAYGGVAGHVFERPGTYEVRLTVTDRAGATSVATRRIVVDDPDVVWPPATKTACVSASGNFAGCPAPAGPGRLTSDSFATGVGNALGAGFRRILFRRGDTFRTGPFFTPTVDGVLVGAYGDAADPRPRIEMTANEPRGALALKGSDWRIQDLEFQARGTPMSAIESFARIHDILVLRNRIQTRDQANIVFATNGPPEVLSHVAIVDNELRGTTSRAVGGGGTCFYGGAYSNMFAGNRCGRGTAWQIRIIFNDRSVFQHNIVEENAGAYEATKYHCVGGPSVRCRFNVVSDNVFARERLNITGGSAEDGNVITDSVFERNYVPRGIIVMEQPGNLFRHNVVRQFRIDPRVFDAKLSRNNVFENNTCYGANVTPECVRINKGADGTGTVARNNLFYAGTFPSRARFASVSGVGRVAESGNRIVTGATSPWVSSSPSRLADFRLKRGSPLINSGVGGGGRSTDLLSLPAPSGGAVDVGAVETQQAAPPSDPEPKRPERRRRARE
jgi:hypothetical protein